MSVRRRRPETNPVPEQLARFVRSEWPAHLPTEDAIDMWAAEREEWALANSYDWFGGVTSPLGDMLDRRRAKRDAWLLCCTEREEDPAEANGVH